MIGESNDFTSIFTAVNIKRYTFSNISDTIDSRYFVSELSKTRASFNPPDLPLTVVLFIALRGCYVVIIVDNGRCTSVADNVGSGG